MQTLFKYATRTLPSFQLLALRSAVLVLVNCYVMARAKVPTDICDHSGSSFSIFSVQTGDNASISGGGSIVNDVLLSQLYSSKHSHYAIQHWTDLHILY